LSSNLNTAKKKKWQSWDMWLMPIILATWETEIRRIAVPSQSQKVVQEFLSQKYTTQPDAGGSHL
jgi:hypothetical protein